MRYRSARPALPRGLSSLGDCPRDPCGTVERGQESRVDLGSTTEPSTRAPAGGRKTVPGGANTERLVWQTPSCGSNRPLSRPPHAWATAGQRPLFAAEADRDPPASSRPPPILKAGPAPLLPSGL